MIRAFLWTKKVSYLIEIMTLEEKVGQMVQPEQKLRYTQRCK